MRAGYDCYWLQVGITLGCVITLLLSIYDLLKRSFSLETKLRMGRRVQVREERPSAQQTRHDETLFWKLRPTPTWPKRAIGRRNQQVFPLVAVRKSASPSSFPRVTVTAPRWEKRPSFFQSFRCILCVSSMRGFSLLLDGGSTARRLVLPVPGRPTIEEKGVHRV